jgi:hypothetical protein
LSLNSSGSRNFDLVTLDRQLSGAPNFFLSPDWPAVLSWLKKNYDHCLVTLSPVLAGLGASEAAIASDSVVLTIRPGETKPQDLAAALAQLVQSASPRPEIVVVGVPAKEISEWYLPSTTTSV